MSVSWRAARNAGRRPVLLSEQGPCLRSQGGVPGAERFPRWRPEQVLGLHGPRDGCGPRAGGSGAHYEFGQGEDDDAGRRARHGRRPMGHALRRRRGDAPVIDILASDPEGTVRRALELRHGVADGWPPCPGIAPDGNIAVAASGEEPSPQDLTRIDLGLAPAATAAPRRQRSVAPCPRGCAR